MIRRMLHHLTEYPRYRSYVAHTGMLLANLTVFVQPGERASMAMLKSGALVLATALLSGSVLAQSYPVKSVRIVVPSVAGGNIEQVARLAGQRLTETLGRTFVIDNRPGASGNIGADHVAKSPPDGYTLLMSSTAALAA